MKMKLSIIGFGNFGQLAAKHLKKIADVSVTDIINKTDEATRFGIKFVSLDRALDNKIIVLAVPMSNLSETLRKIKTRLKPNTLVLDVCSLKIFSCKAMLDILPQDTEIIGTHPLFGPESAPTSIKGLKIALCNVRSSRQTFEKVEQACKQLQLKTYVTTPEEHDKQMAVSQALTHFIGQVAKRMNIERVDLSTKTFDDLMDIVETIKNDPLDLFENMQIMNPFAKEVRNEFIQTSKKLNNNLSKKNTRLKV